MRVTIRSTTKSTGQKTKKRKKGAANAAVTSLVLANTKMKAITYAIQHTIAQASEDNGKQCPNPPCGNK